MKDELREHLSQSLIEGDSPIEKMLGHCLYLVAGMEALESGQIFDIKFQHPIEGYRVDIALIGQDVKVAIECDGHDFHEKTKLQAASDKRRDRAITCAGFKMLRYTGSEIWRNPLECAEEAVALAKSMFSDAAEAYYFATRDAAAAQ